MNVPGLNIVEKYKDQYKISVRPEIFLKILYLNSSLSCVVYQKIVCTLTKLIVSVENVETFSRKLLCSLVKRACTFDRQCLF